MLPSYFSHYFFISQSVPNLYFLSPALINLDSCRIPFFTDSYETPHKSHQVFVMPNLAKSKSSSKNIYSQEKLIKSKFKNHDQKRLDDAKLLKKK